MARPGKTASHYDSDRQNHLLQPGPQHHQHGQAEQQTGERHKHIYRAHEETLDPAAAVAGDQADERSESATERHCANAHQQRDPASVQDAYEDVSTERVAAHEVDRIGAVQSIGRALLEWIERADQRRAERDIRATDAVITRPRVSAV